MMPKRIQCKRVRGWRMPPNTVYVGRPTKWGNPYETAYAFRHWIIGDTKDFRGYQDRRAWILENIHLLAGKNLACWCPLDQECHADFLLEMANKGISERIRRLFIPY